LAGSEIVNVRPPILTVSDRGLVPLLGAALTVTVPLPKPLAPAVIVSHDAVVVAVHEQSAGAVTVIEVVSPPTGEVRLVGLMAVTQGVVPTPACVTVTVRPATVSVPLRCDVAELAVAAKEAVPVPVTGVGDVIDSQLLFAVADHWHPAAAVTVIDPLDAVTGNDADVADSTGAHGEAPACVTVTVCPAMVSVPVRCVGDEFAAASKATVPLPETGVADVTDSQLLFAVADHSHVAAAETVMVPDDGVDAMNAELADSAGAHGSAVAPAWVIVTVLPAMVSVPERGAGSALTVAAKATVPFPVTVVADVIDNQLASAVAVHSQVVPVVTMIVPVDAAEEMGTRFADSTGVQGAELANVFDNWLTDAPPGPIATIRAWYTVPPTSGVVRSGANTTRTVPSASGAGFPRSNAYAGTVDPTARISST
jgi:hypothetical protein